MSWLPITDLSRASDIRMRRRRALLLLGSVVFVPWMVWGDHHSTRSPIHLHYRITLPTVSAPETRRIAADTLRIDLPCASQLTVSPDPTLSGQAILSASSRALAAIAVSGGSLSSGEDCADDSAVTIRTSNVTPIQLVQSGDNDIRTGRFDSAVTVDSQGSGTVSLEHAGTLVVRSGGSGDVTVGSVTGPLTATMNGSGDLRVDGGTIPVLDASSRAGADLLLDRVQVLGGRVSLDGSGDLHLAGASGTFEVTAHGSGGITIGRVDTDRLALIGDGSGDIKIGAGRINVLDVERSGSGDLSIEAVIHGGRLDQRGSGDVSIPHGEDLVRSDR